MVQDFPNEMSSAGCFLTLTLRFHLFSANRFVLFCFHTSEKRELFWKFLWKLQYRNNERNDLCGKIDSVLERLWSLF